MILLCRRNEIVCLVSCWDILIFDMWPVHFLRAKFIDFWRGNFSRVRSSTFDMYGPFMNASMCLLTSEGSGIVTECMLIVVVIFVCLSYHGSLHRWWIGSDHFYSERRSCRCESCRKVVPKRMFSGIEKARISFVTFLHKNENTKIWAN